MNDLGPFNRNTIVTGDAIETIAQLPDDCADLLFLDPPYQTTAAEWDKPVDWEALGLHTLRILKSTGQVFSFANLDLTITLRQAFPLKFRYEIILYKQGGFGPVFASARQPTRVHEYGVIWCHPNAHISTLAWNEYFLSTKKERTPAVRIKQKANSSLHRMDPSGYYTESSIRRPTSVMPVSGKPNLRAVERTGHGTQKEFLFCAKWVGALSNKGDLVVDLFVGTGTTIAAAAHLGRDFFGCDIQEDWAEFAAERARQAMEAKKPG